MTAETIPYSLESVLKEIKDSIQSVDRKLNNLEKGFDQKLETLHKLVVGQLLALGKRGSPLQINKIEFFD